ncbi:TetM/TetW/TetO/TetS family tetracycline resistance ribosomal protection protein [Lactobacillus sp. ESL0701]|uniref:elongation factor G n=1 Tax=Lactobacillus sp. ESL0701 TaxID=2983217 RepID=UPI0023F7B792|nr:TetM/TetW/TetO/TetS family tetracycline resistance ribosomal protection protein [Lactobacillus sp. ESL0701]MDF7672648.1 TetM/TetW/TetO/TetS family tetracycline resistance ribosomal protection protein [Lactobacillus sp. ESL0701]
MKQIVAGILANVDAGKTTLSEALLYRTGTIRQLGRVDNGNAFLDSDQLEKRRGITIFSHQANLEYQDLKLTLLDTPGHVDFLAQTEGVLSVLDYAILVISATAGVQSQTRKLWQLLQQYQVPTFIFINKMDASQAELSTIITQLQTELSAGCVNFELKNQQLSASSQEQIVVQDDDVLTDYLSSGTIDNATIRQMIKKRQIFPCYFGSALKLQGIKELLSEIAFWSEEYQSSISEFGARVFKISHNAKGERLTWLRVMSGSLQPKQILLTDQKINQLRIYQGEKFTTKQEVTAGQICTIPNLVGTYQGQGLGLEHDSQDSQVQPVLTYSADPKDYDPHTCLLALKELEDEDPQLHVVWDESSQSISVRIMGEVQLEVLQQLLQERFNLQLEFGTGKILYKETVTDSVEGAGHFEPLRHYAETHVVLEPLPAGSGLVIVNDCPNEVLAPNWQKQVMFDLQTKEHLGVLIGAPITDMKIRFVSGHYSYKHTQGGDFRKAAWRAVRQGLMLLKAKGKCQLLEPWYHFRLEIASTQIGRAISDIQQMKGTFNEPEVGTNQEMEVLTGSAPVKQMQNYAKVVRNYIHGQGNLECTFDCYHPCQNATEIIAAYDYSPTHDLANTPDSVFVPNEIATRIPWNEVPEWAHVPYQNKYKFGGYHA